MITSPSAVSACPPTGNTHTAVNGSGFGLARLSRLAALKAARAFHRSFERQLGPAGAALRDLLSGLVSRDGGTEALERVLRPF